MDLYYECMACKKIQITPASLNRHINKCKEYSTFIKTYKPSKCITCSKCGINYTSADILNSHICRES